MEKDRSGYVYVIRSMMDPAIRIGRTQFPKSRMRVVNMGSSLDLNIEHLIESDDCFSAARFLKLKYKQFRVKGKTHWYTLPEAELNKLLKIDKLNFKDPPNHNSHYQDYEILLIYLLGGSKENMEKLALMLGRKFTAIDYVWSQINYGKVIGNNEEGKNTNQIQAQIEKVKSWYPESKGIFSSN